MWTKVLLLFLAGGLGTLARFGIYSLTQRSLDSELPFGTFAANMIGCFLFGFVWSMAEGRIVISAETRFIILAGFMGALTTFSTFAFESGIMLRNGPLWHAIANLLAHNVLGILAVFAGLALEKKVFPQ